MKESQGPLISPKWIKSIERDYEVVTIDIEAPHALPAHSPEDNWIRIGNFQHIIRNFNANGKGSETAVSSTGVIVDNGHSSGV